MRTAARQDGSGRETGDHRSNEEDPDEVPTDRSKGKREKDQHQHAERCCIQDQRLPRAGREVSGGDGRANVLQGDARSIEDLGQSDPLDVGGPKRSVLAGRDDADVD